MAAIYDIFE